VEQSRPWLADSKVKTVLSLTPTRNASLTEGEIVTPTLLARRFTLGHILAGGAASVAANRNAAHPSLQAREPPGPATCLESARRGWDGTRLKLSFEASTGRRFARGRS
jgi:hypothetical protein